MIPFKIGDVVETKIGVTPYREGVVADWGKNIFEDSIISLENDTKFLFAHDFKHKEKSPPSEFKKDNQGKPRLSLIPRQMIDDLIAVLEHGAVKYGDKNYLNCKTPNNTYTDALWRHLRSHENGEVIDPETGKPHLIHGIANLVMLLDAVVYNAKEAK